MREVACWPLATLYATFRETGYSERELDRLTAGLDVSRSHVESRIRWLSWSDFTTVLDRMTDLVGGLDAFEAFSRTCSATTVNRTRAVRIRSLTVRAIYIIGARVAGPAIFRPTRGSHVELPEGRIGQVVEILPAYRDSQPFFYAMRGILRSVPARLGLPDSEVAMELGPRRAVYTITPPPMLGRDAPAEISEEAVIEAFAASEMASVHRSAGEPVAPEQVSPGVVTASRTTFAEIVRRALVEELAGRAPTAEQVAQRLQMGTRSLARRLAEEGTSFQEIRDELRRDLAIRYLEQSMPISEVAYELGFSDVTSFHRAFRRWTGATPSEHRAGLQSRPSMPTE